MRAVIVRFEIPKIVVWAVVIAASLRIAPALGAQTLTQDQALALAFPGAEVQRRTAFLTEDQLARAALLAGPEVTLESEIVSYYVATQHGHPVGAAYFDAHRVRTLPQVLMVVVEPAGRVVRVETVSFREPPEYRAPVSWLRQFEGRSLDASVSLKGEIANITGATLTAVGATNAVRRTLALHSVIDPLGADR